MDDGRALRDTQAHRYPRYRGNDFMHQQFSARLETLFDQVSGKARLSRQGVVHHAPMDEGAPSLLRTHEPSRLKMLQRLANGEAADAETRHQLRLGRQLFSGGKRPGGNLRRQDLPDLMPQCTSAFAINHRQPAQTRFSSLKSSLYSAG